MIIYVYIMYIYVPRNRLFPNFCLFGVNSNPPFGIGACAEAVRDFVAHVLSPSRHVPKPLEPEQIVVLTPYLQQKELLQSALEKAKLQVRERSLSDFEHFLS